MTSEGHKGPQSSEKEKVLHVGIFKESMADGNELGVSCGKDTGCASKETLGRTPLPQPGNCWAAAKKRSGENGPGA